MISIGQLLHPKRRSGVRRTPLAARVGLIAMALACSACVTGARIDPPPPFAPHAAPIGFPTSVRIDAFDRASFEEQASETTRRLREAATDGTVDILALSGGGANGAFGAGVLVGLTQRGERPQYELVTGVSTGALIASFAFLGPDWDPQLTQAYASGLSADLMRSYGLSAPFRTAFFRGAPLRQLVETFVTDELVAAVAREGSSGRLLLVATTNLDREEAVIWNMTAIAAVGGERARELYRDVLIASASVPGVFPPIMMKVGDGTRLYEEMHVDGGAVVPFFAAPDVAFILDYAPEALRGARMYIVINGQITTPSSATPVNTIPIIRRTFSAVGAHMARTSLIQNEAFARRNQMDFRYTAIPVGYPHAGALEFSPDLKRALFDLGVRCAAEGRVWVSIEQVRADLARPQPTPDADACPVAAPEQ